MASLPGRNRLLGAWLGGMSLVAACSSEPSLDGSGAGSAGPSGGASGPPGGAGSEVGGSVAASGGSSGAGGTSTSGASTAGALAGLGGSSGAFGASGEANAGSSGMAPEPCTGPPVKVTRSGTKLVFDDGFVQATINGSNATVPSFVVSGVETMTTGGYFSWGTNVYTAGPFTAELSADPANNGGELAEVVLTTKWDQSAGKIPLDLEVRFAMPRCARGLYEYVVLTHPTSYPAFTPGELRVNHYVAWDDVFDWYAVDDARRGVFTSKASATAATAVAGAPKEVLKYPSGPFADRPGWQKYDNSVEWGEGTVYGWSSTKKRVGLWLINPSNEYLPGGPMKLELTLHDAGSKATLLNYFGGNHFYGALEDVEAGQLRQKVLGPWLLYGNTTASTGAAGHDALWADAKRRLEVERAAWPYAWETASEYPARAGRGSVEGTLSLAADWQSGASLAPAWIGLAGPPVNGAPSFEHQAWDYQYWVHPDAGGAFRIPHVRPGKYTLHAFVPGVHGVYVGGGSSVTVSAAQTTKLGAITWAPDRMGPTVWEIGVPDRTPREYRRGNEAWRWGLRARLATDFPDGVQYVVGTSDWRKDWSLLQAGGSSNVQFDVTSIPTNASGASLVLDLAGSDGVTVTATLNGAQVGSASMPFDDGSIDRDQPHGAYQSARIAIPLPRIQLGTNRLVLASSSNLMWDYLRLEWIEK